MFSYFDQLTPSGSVMCSRLHLPPAASETRRPRVFPELFARHSLPLPP